MYFLNYRLRKTWLDLCPKSCVSQDNSTDNMANGSKHCCNLKSSSFAIFVNYCAGSCISSTDIQNPKTIC